MNRRERRRQAKAARKGRQAAAAPTSARVAGDETERFLDAAAEAQARGDLDLAERYCRDVLEQKPNHPEGLNLLGILRCQAGRPEDGIQLISQAAAADPQDASFRNNLGTALSSLGRDGEALEAFERAVGLSAVYPTAHNNLGTVYRRLGRLDDAAREFQLAIEQQPDYAEAYSNYTNVLIDTDRIEEAAATVARALELKPDYPYARNNLGTVLMRLGRFGEAMEAFRRAMELLPGFADPYSNMGEALKAAGRTHESIAFFRRALELEPNRPGVHSNLVFACNCLDGMTPAAVTAEHKAWAAAHGGTARADHGNDPDPERRLRIGYVSPDFRQHSVCYFFESLLDGHDREGFEIYLYANMPKEDHVSARFRTKADGWRNVFALDDGEMAEKVRGDGIDILVDLPGHTMGNRLPAFSLKPAPVQVTYLGYPATTGLDAVDYRITDPWADPPGETEAYHTETLVHLENGFLCYRPPEDAPDVAPPPCLDRGHVTFGSCNNIAKVTPAVVETWAAVLRRVPDSRLLLKSKAMGDAQVQAYFHQAFAAHGVGADRLEMLGWITSGSHLSIYDGIDIALDPFPYNGTTTICETMWMGVPTVALEGQWHAARVAHSLNARIGQGDLTAADRNAYVEIATTLANDPERLASLRTGMRDTLVASGLIDAPAFTRSLEQAYRQMWRAWCA